MKWRVLPWQQCRIPFIPLLGGISLHETQAEEIGIVFVVIVVVVGGVVVSPKPREFGVPASATE